MEEAIKALKSLRKETAKRKYEEGGMKAVFAAMRSPKPPGIGLLKKGDTYTADPQEVEELLRGHGTKSTIHPTMTWRSVPGSTMRTMRVTYTRRPSTP